MMQKQQLPPLVPHNTFAQTILKLICFLSATYLLASLFTPLTWLMIAAFVLSSTMLLRMFLNKIKQQGFKEKLSPKMQEILFDKSFYDIYADFVYYPKIVKTIKKYLGPVVNKPPPSELKNVFEDFSPNSQRAINTKGIIHLLPQKIKSKVIYSDNEQYQEEGPEQQIQWNWHNLKKYQEQQVKPHEVTLSSQVLERLDSRVSWIGIACMIALLSIGISQMRVQRFKKMLIINGCFTGFLFTLLLILVKIKKLKKKQVPQKRLALPQIQ